MHHPPLLERTGFEPSIWAPHCAMLKSCCFFFPELAYSYCVPSTSKKIISTLRAQLELFTEVLCLRGPPLPSRVDYKNILLHFDFKEEYLFEFNGIVPGSITITTDPGPCCFTARNAYAAALLLPGFGSLGFSPLLAPLKRKWNVNISRYSSALDLT